MSQAHHLGSCPFLSDHWDRWVSGRVPSMIGFSEANFLTCSHQEAPGQHGTTNVATRFHVDGWPLGALEAMPLSKATKAGIFSMGGLSRVRLSAHVQLSGKHVGRPLNPYGSSSIGPQASVMRRSASSHPSRHCEGRDSASAWEFSLPGTCLGNNWTSNCCALSTIALDNSQALVESCCVPCLATAARAVMLSVYNTTRRPLRSSPPASRPLRIASNSLELIACRESVTGFDLSNLLESVTTEKPMDDSLASVVSEAVTGRTSSDIARGFARASAHHCKSSRASPAASKRPPSLLDRMR